MATLTKPVIWDNRIFISGQGVYYDEANKKENKMNKFISDNYKNTDDALLVEKWISKDLPCGSAVLNQLLLGDKIKDLLEEAKRLEEKNK